MGPFIGQNQFRCALCLLLQQLCRFPHQLKRWDCTVLLGDSNFFFFIISIRVKQQKTFLGLHESLLQIIFAGRLLKG